MPQPVQRTSLADLAVDGLLKLIEERGLRPNDALPSTADIAEELDVSRTIIREAIAELAGQGLLQRRQGRETLVSLPDSGQLERLLRLRFAVQGADFESLEEFREILEVNAARLAAERAKDQDIRSLEERNEIFANAKSNAEFFEADQAFHREVARTSANDMVLLTSEGITPLLFQLRQRSWAGWMKSGHGREPLIEAHVAILDRIRERDPDGASTAMRYHLNQAAEGLAVLRQNKQAS